MSGCGNAERMGNPIWMVTLLDVAEEIQIQNFPQNAADH